VLGFDRGIWYGKKLGVVVVVVEMAGDEMVDEAVCVLGND